MRKLFLSLVAALVAATTIQAQTSLLATLSHDGEVSTFYGASALKEAHDAAVNGDIITLSGGSFAAVDITKAVTIRGAGMEANAATQAEPTIIMGDFKINIPEETTERLTIEGIYSNHTVTYMDELVNATFIKDRFKRVIYANQYCELVNATFIHCKIAEEVGLVNNINSSNTASASFVNCIVWNPSFSSVISDLTNCIVKLNPNFAYNTTWKNSILITSASASMPTNSTAFNSLGLYTGGSSTLFKNMNNTSNTLLDFNGSKVFKDFDGNYSDSYDFALTDEAAAKYLGTDGTQVGIYGGSLPFTATPSNPQITKCNVAAKSTADGKLSVDITVGAAE